MVISFKPTRSINALYPTELAWRDIEQIYPEAGPKWDIFWAACGQEMPAIRLVYFDTTWKKMADFPPDLYRYKRDRTQYEIWAFEHDGDGVVPEYRSPYIELIPHSTGTLLSPLWWPWPFNLERWNRTTWRYLSAIECWVSYPQDRSRYYGDNLLFNNNNRLFSTQPLPVLPVIFEEPEHSSFELWLEAFKDRYHSRPHELLLDDVNKKID